MTKLDLVIETAEKLLSNNYYTTTKEIKEALRERQPNVDWRQDEVSNFMSIAHSSGLIANLKFLDNGMYREYFVDSPTFTKTYVKTLVKDIAGKIKNLF